MQETDSASGWRYWLREHRLLLWAVVFSPCHLFWILPLLGALLASTPFDSLFRQVRFPLEVTLAVLLSFHSIVIFALWALRPARQGARMKATHSAPDHAAATPPVAR